MYVFIANGYTGIIKDKYTLDVLASIYPYPKFRKVFSEEEAIKFINRNPRHYTEPIFSNYGSTDKSYGYVNASYIIDSSGLYINYDTSKVGFIKIKERKNKEINFVVDNRPSMIKVKIEDLKLNDDLISDHCVAITNLLECLGGYVDINISIPDISIFLAINRYSGSNYIINDLREIIDDRLGGVSLTIK